MRRSKLPLYSVHQVMSGSSLNLPFLPWRIYREPLEPIQASKLLGENFSALNQ